MSTLYRVYVETNGPREWVEYLEADTPAAAIAEADDDPEAPTYLVAIPLPEEMESECVCSEEKDNGYELRLFKRIEATSPAQQCWECQNCHRDYVCPPDEVNWDNERMFDEGYEVCYRHEGYKDNCHWCHGSGWWRPGDDEEEDYDGEAWPPDGEEIPYYELDETLYLED